LSSTLRPITAFGRKLLFVALQITSVEGLLWGVKRKFIPESGL
jgi:hypothetical protein